ncbi:hypothetical protein HDV00_008700 [Rhizophlyctis rosea]|nr:hypothetical protein HDV00_008700 [Rhizophlyctis rosea]
MTDGTSNPVSEVEKFPPLRKTSVGYTFDYTFYGVRQAFKRAQDKKERVTIQSAPFGACCTRWELLVMLDCREDIVGAPCMSAFCAVQEEEENWSRVLEKIEVSVVHPTDKTLNLQKTGATEVELADDGNEDWGFKNIASKEELETYFSPDGSLTLKVDLRERLPTSYMRPSSFTRPPFADYFLDESLADVDILVSNDSDDDNNDAHDPLPAHSLVLTCRSPYFKSLFSSGMSSLTTTTSPPSVQNPTRRPIEIKEFSLETIKSLLEFLYSNNLHTYTPPDLPARLDLLQAADYFQVEDLHLVVANVILEKDFNLSTAMTIAIHANKYKGVCSVLADRVNAYLKCNWEKFTTQKEFLEGLEENGLGIIADMYA